MEMEELDETEQDALKLQLHSIPLNLDSMVTIDTEDEESDEEDDSILETFNPATATPSDPPPLPNPDEPSTSKAGNWELAIPNEDSHTEESQDEASDTEELIDLSADLPPNPLNLLKLNLAYQEVIQQELVKIDRQLQEIHFKSSLIKEEEERRSANPHVKSYIPVNSFRPYFKDINGNPAPPNSEFHRRKDEVGELYVPDPKAARKWTKQNEECLHQAIEKNALRHATEPLLSKLEYLQSKYKSSGDEIYPDKIAAVKKEIANASSKVPGLVAQRFFEWDWDSISILDMQSTYNPINCRLHWMNVLHPSLQKSKSWTVGETTLLKDTIAGNKNRNWKEISDLIPGRSPCDCLARYHNHISTSFKKKSWTPEEDDILIKLVDKFRVGHVIPYTQIACHMKGRIAAQLVHRWTKTLDPACKRTKWTPAEDAMLIKAVHIHGQKWSRIRDLGLVPGRNDSQMRERYINAIKSGRVGSWRREEDEKLMKIVAKVGHGNWSKVSEMFEDRSDSQCAKRWRLLEQSRKHGIQVTYKAIGSSPYYQNIQRMREKLTTSIVAEQMSVKIESANSSTADDGGDLIEDPSTKERHLIKISHDRTKPGTQSYKQLDVLDKLSSNMSSEDVVKLYNQLIRLSSDKPKKQTSKEDKMLMEAVGEFYHPMKAISREAGNPINDHYERLKVKTDDANAKSLFIHYIKALNINAHSALDSIKKKKKEKENSKQGTLKDYLSDETAQKKQRLEEMKQMMTGKTKENVKSVSKKPRVFARNLFLPLCAPNRATSQAYRKLTKNRQYRIDTAKAILTDANRAPTTRSSVTSSSVAPDNATSPTSDHLVATVRPVVTEETLASTSDATNDGDVMCMAKSVTVEDSNVAPASDEVKPDSGDVKRFRSAELLANMRTSYKYKIFRSRFNALLTWPTFMSSLVPYVRVQSDNTLRPAVRIKRRAPQHPPDVAQAKKPKP